MNEFFAMGGYAGYVWSAVGLTLAVLVANALWARARLKAALTEAARGGVTTTDAPVRRPTVVEQS